MTAEDDEAMARALQEKYERQAKRRASRMSARSGNRAAQSNNQSNNTSRDAESGVASGDEGGPVVSPRPKSRPPLSASARSSRAIENKKERSNRLLSTEDSPDTSNDAELARRIAERSSHQRSKRRSDPPEVKTNAEEEKAPDTSNDAELARKLAERSSHRRSTRGRSASVERSSVRRNASVDRSSVRSSVRQSTAAEPKEEGAPAPDTSNDAELARRLAEGKSSHRPSARSASVERTSVRRIVTQPEEQKEEVTAPDTSKDAALARQLSERFSSSNKRSAQRSSRRVVAADPPAEEPAAPAPDTSKDEELARRLSMALETKPKRRTIQPVVEPEPATAPTEPVSEADDEALARKLEQELKDEELAQRLNQQEAKRRRRAGYLARKKAAQRNRNMNDSDAAAGEGTKGPRSSLQAQDPPSDDGGISPVRSKSDLLAFDSGDEYGDGDPERGRSRRPNNQKNRARSSSRDSDDGGGRRHRSRSRDPDDFRELRSSTKSKRNMRSASPVRREQALIIDLHEESDREVAMKLDQEDRDEALARSLTMREAKRIAVYQVDSTQTSRGRNRWSCRRVMSLAIPVVVILAAVVGLAFAFTGGEGLPSLPGVPPFFDEGDPFQGKNPDEANRWRNNGNGLSLELLNALDDRWHVNFDVAVNEWDFGDPDALTLTVDKVAIDSACSDLTGYLKVCNGDYGETKWRGINQVILSNGFIISSVAKLNEFYLGGADEAQRQYTMCHEIGHGFGLPHTDENFYNADLGNCMDYTSNPEANKSPDATNYAFLADLYGTVGNRRRLLRHRKPSTKVDDDDVPDDLHLRVAEALSELEGDVVGGRFKSRVMHSSAFAESVRIDLGDGLELQLHKLLAEPERTESI